MPDTDLEVISKRSNRRLGFGCGVPAIIFGSYLLYDRLYLTLRSGVTSQRVGEVARAEEPNSYWTYLAIDTVQAAIVIALGFLFIFAFLKANKRPTDSDESQSDESATA